MDSLLSSEEFTGFGFDQIEREIKVKRLLDDRAHSSSQPTHQMWFMNKLCELPIIRVPIELPMYRLQNGRTLSLQDEYIATTDNVPDDFFSRDLNSPEAQRIQHTLLISLNENREILKYFKDTSNIQIAPLICTNSGFVVNGNRRLCCWRELFCLDKKSYRHFEYIFIAILPECDEKAVEQLEADLQIRPDIEENYAWHTRVKLMKKHKDNGENSDAIAKFFGINSGKEVDEWLDMFDYADKYLKWKGWERQWSKVGGEYTFREIVSNRKNISHSIDKAFFEKMAFAYLYVSSDTPGDVEGRLYGKIPEIKKYLPEIKDVLSAELKSEVADVDTVDDDSNLLLGDNFSSTDNVIIAVTKILDDDKMQKDAVRIAESVIQEQKALAKETKDKNYIVERARKANTYLHDALVATTSVGHDKFVTSGLEGQLEAIINNVQGLREWLKKNGTSNRL